MHIRARTFSKFGTPCQLQNSIFYYVLYLVGKGGQVIAALAAAALAESAAAESAAAGCALLVAVAG